ncbi:RNA-binding protein FUS-like [Neltuma alba]|uniref:RNA-binding protein FUS-like n=1 Tax=Neltuma alba TaxID=207710 RepID=UPI0010A45BE1|nr:RNA-binding protein FUS-like [Prosopis alba]XP_028801803.1 RNA-binding protein FUS-like [Prosopis alba]
MSFQVQPQAQPQQPVQVYPATVTTQPPSHHSNGSFGTVFIVLAVILVISLLACFLGRLCSRRRHPESYGGGHHGHKPYKQQNMNQNPNPSQNYQFRPQEGDVELGFDKRIPTTKPNGHGNGPGPGLGYGSQGSKPPFYGGNGGNGDVNGEEKGFEMRNGREGSMREQGHGPRPGLGYGGRGPRPLVYGGGRGGNGGAGGGEERGFEMKNGGERSMREQGHGHDAPYKFTL